VTEPPREFLPEISSLCDSLVNEWSQKVSVGSTCHIRTFHRLPDDEVKTWDRPTPDWRFQRAKDIANRDGRHRLRYDATVWAIVDCLGGLPSARRHQLTQGRDLNWPSLIGIRDSYLTRLSVEARLLAYRDVCVVSQIHGYQVELLGQYCDVFFDVFPCLNASGWIVNQVIHQPAESHPDLLRQKLYHYAYFGGEMAVEHFIDHLPYLNQGIDHDLETSEGREREALELQLLQHSLNENIDWSEKSLSLMAELANATPNTITASLPEIFGRSVLSEIAANWNELMARSADDGEEDTEAQTSGHNVA